MKQQQHTSMQAVVYHKQRCGLQRWSKSERGRPSASATTSNHKQGQPAVKTKGWYWIWVCHNVFWAQSLTNGAEPWKALHPIRIWHHPSVWTAGCPNLGSVGAACLPEFLAYFSSAHHIIAACIDVCSLLLHPWPVPGWVNVLNLFNLLNGVFLILLTPSPCSWCFSYHVSRVFLDLPLIHSIPHWNCHGSMNTKYTLWAVLVKQCTHCVHTCRN